MADCSTHGTSATGKCFVCHRPYCPQCRPRDSCCSERCYQNRQKFSGATERVTRPGFDPLAYLIPLVKLGVAGGVAYAAGKYFELF